MKEIGKSRICNDVGRKIIEFAPIPDQLKEKVAYGKILFVKSAQRHILQFISFLTALGVLSFCSSASADIITLSDGRRLEGKITSETPSDMAIQLHYSTLTLPRDQVKSVEKGKTPLEIYEEKSKTSDNTAPCHYELARWCKEKGLDAEYTAELRKTLKIDPKYENAVKALALIKPVSDQDIGAFVRGFIATDDEVDRVIMVEKFAPKIVDSFDRLENAVRNFRKYSSAKKEFTYDKFKVGETETEYALYVPKKYSPDKSFPLLVALHGAGGNGRSYIKMWQFPATVKELGEAQSVLYQQAERRSYIVLCPTAQKEYGWFTEEAQKQVFGLIEKITVQFNIDPDRIYLHGLSMGGRGTYHFGLHFADRFAAIESRAGATELTLLPNLLNLPIYITHGAKDQLAPVELARKIKEKLSELKYDYLYSEHPDKGHVPIPEENKKVIDFFEKKRRNIYPKRVLWTADGSAFSRAYWLNIDRMTPPATVDAEVSREKNSIEVKTTNIQKLTLYLSDKLLDLSKEVKIIVNGAVLFSGKVDRSVFFLLSHLRQTRDSGRIFANSISVDIP